MADAIKIHRGELSCWVTRTTPRGRYLSSSMFDVPSEGAEDGYVTGARLALELVRLMRSASLDQRHAIGYRVWETCCEAASVPRDDGRRWAAWGLLVTMNGVLLGGILHTESEAYAAERLADAERNRAYMAARDAKARADFVQRMRSARAAKRQETAAQGGQQ
jgi:hypothetical protein